MKKYLYMIVALFGIDYFCKENIEAQKPEDFPRDMEKSHGKIRLYRNHNDGFCFGVKKEKKELVRMVSLRRGVFPGGVQWAGPHGAGCLYLGGSGHSDMVTVPGRRQKSRSDRVCPHHGGWFKQPV